MAMTASERKAAFRAAADQEGLTLSAAALLRCGVTWMHLSTGISNPIVRPLGDEVKQKFAAYIGRTVEDVFGASQEAA